jgi:hypothetical protein
MAFVLGLVMVGEILFVYSIIVILPQSNFFALIFSNVVVDSTNAERVKLSENTLTEKAAQMKADDMAIKGYFAHVTPEGHSPWYWLDEAEYVYSYAGENLAVNFTDSQDVVDAWMASPGHKANIINDNYTEIGIATATGMYKDREAIFVVQFFGRPALKAASIVKPSASPKPVQTVTPVPTKSQNDTIATVNSETVSMPDKNLPSQDPKSPIAYSSAQDRLMTKPHGFASGLLFIILSAFALAMTLTIFVRNGVLKTRAIFNGALAIAVIIAILLSNQYIGTLNASIF